MKQLNVLFCDDQPEIHIASAIQQSNCRFLGKVDSPKALFSYLHQQQNIIPDVLFIDARFNTREIDQQYSELRETLQELKTYPEWTTIKIVVLTGVPVQELFNLAYPYINGFIDKADYQRAISDAITVFMYGDEDATYFNKFMPWKPRDQTVGVWSQFTALQLSILEDCLKGHSDEYIQAKHGMRNHSNLSGRIDHIVTRLIEISSRAQFYMTFGDMTKGKLSIRQKFWIMLQISLELRHPAALELLKANGLQSR